MSMACTFYILEPHILIAKCIFCAEFYVKTSASRSTHLYFFNCFLILIVQFSFINYRLRMNFVVTCWKRFKSTPLMLKVWLRRGTGHNRRYIILISFSIVNLLDSDWLKTVSIKHYNWYAFSPMVIGDAHTSAESQTQNWNKRKFFQVKKTKKK